LRILRQNMSKDKVERKQTARNKKVNKNKTKRYESRDDNVVKKD